MEQVQADVANGLSDCVSSDAKMTCAAGSNSTTFSVSVSCGREFLSKIINLEQLEKDRFDAQMSLISRVESILLDLKMPGPLCRERAEEIVLKGVPCTPECDPDDVHAPQLIADLAELTKIGKTLSCCQCLIVAAPDNEILYDKVINGLKRQFTDADRRSQMMESALNGAFPEIHFTDDERDLLATTVMVRSQSELQIEIRKHFKDRATRAVYAWVIFIGHGSGEKKALVITGRDGVDRYVKFDDVIDYIEVHSTLSILHPPHAFPYKTRVIFANCNSHTHTKKNTEKMEIVALSSQERPNTWKTVNALTGLFHCIELTEYLESEHHRCMADIRDMVDWAEAELRQDQDDDMESKEQGTKLASQDVINPMELDVSVNDDGNDMN